MYMSGLSHMGEFENTPGVTDGGMQDAYDAAGGYDAAIANAGAGNTAFGNDSYTALITQGLSTWVNLSESQAQRDYNLALAARGYAPPGYTRGNLSPSYVSRPISLSPFQSGLGANGGTLLLLAAVAVAAYILLKKG